jgi:outer membrane protein OmpA-like peptidoglycan-associated protein
MSLKTKIGATLVVVAFMLATTGAYAENVTLTTVLYPDNEKTAVKFSTTDRAPKAQVSASVKPEAGQSWIEVSWKKLEPALLFGGDINCYVIWTVTPDGTAVSQGELPVRTDRSGDMRFSVPFKNFALMVTAEPFPVVRKPSTLVIFMSNPTDSKRAKNATVTFGGFRAETKHEQESIAALKYTDKTPVELQQARKAVELMDRFEAEKYAQSAARDARTALSQAEDAYQGRVGKSKDVPELSSRTMSLCNDAVRAAVTQIDAQKAQATEAKRLSELAQKQAETEAERAARVKTEADLATVETQRQALQVEVQKVAAEKAQVEKEKDQMKSERDALAARLSGALGKVAATERTGRGLVVSLSGGILFESGKSALKTNAKVSLAKLSGILMMIPNTNIQVEGHTDATGSAETNQKLSAARAAAVKDFLKSQGVEDSRMASTGFGPSQPVAPNDTAEGRAKNRRVEIVVPDAQAQNSGAR